MRSFELKQHCILLQWILVLVMSHPRIQCPNKCHFDAAVSGSLGAWRHQDSFLLFSGCHLSPAICLNNDQEFLPCTDISMNKKHAIATMAEGTCCGSAGIMTTVGVIFRGLMKDESFEILHESKLASMSTPAVTEWRLFFTNNMLPVLFMLIPSNFVDKLGSQNIS